MSYKAFVASDAYQAGLTDDGRPFTAELYYVVIENQKGRRFRHDRVFLGTEQQIDEDGFNVYFPDLRHQAQAKAEYLAARVNARLAKDLRLNFSYWAEIDPAYGSEEYISQGTEFQRFMAERQDWYHS